MTKDDFYKVLALLSAYYGSKANHLKTLNVQAAWWLALERFPYEAVKTAVVDYAVKSRFFPTVADLVGQLDGESAPEPERKPRKELSQLEKDAIKRMMEWKERSDSP